ncbi:SprA family protein [Alteromonadaceae bacterium 2753L.S.0a.02]|nr:SprA family protein [Alteromonadaceae bacterium 2753L.S.0a.02]
MITTSLPNNLANLVAPFNPVGQRPVGEEDAAGRISSLKPVEQSAAGARTQVRTQQSDSQLGDRESAEETPDSDDAGLDAQRQLSSAEQRRLDQEQQQISKLASRDREVRAHEQAHAAIGGLYAGAAQYQFERGPDGVRYAVGGEVPINVGREASPEATIAKMQIVKRAALAPAEPSPQDRSVAAQASRLEAQARQELRSNEDTNESQTADSQDQGENASSNSVTGPGIAESRPRPSTNNDAPVTPSLPLSGNLLSSRLSASISNTSLESREPGSILDQLV